jgi:hypothetical protein
VRLILLGLLAVLAVSAVASASASAAECKKEANKKFVLCLGEPLVLTEGSFPINIENDTTHNYVLESAGIKITCTVVGNGTNGEVVSSAGSTTVKKLVLEFKTCTVANPAHCTVTEPISTEKLKGTILKKEEIEFTPETGNTFATIKFNSSGGTCIVAGSLKVTGSPEGKGQVCTSPTEVTRENQLFECLATGSHLKLGEESAKFSGDFLVKLLKEGKAQKWAVIEGV